MIKRARTNREGGQRWMDTSTYLQFNHTSSCSRRSRLGDVIRYSMAETISNSGGKGGACGGMVKLLVAIDAPDVSIDQLAYILHRICSEIVNCLLHCFLVNCLLFQQHYMKNNHCHLKPLCFYS